VDKGIYCQKSKSYTIKRNNEKKECVISSKMPCEMLKVDGWIPECKQNFDRINNQTCSPHFPDGWSDLGGICPKPGVINLGDLFVWLEGDE
jgi:hypothetical protein